MGLLDGLLAGGGRRNRRSGMSPQMVALLGMLAVAGYQHRDKLGDLLGGAGTGNAGAGPMGRRTGGGLGGMLGGGAAGGGLGGLLGGLLGGGAGGGMISGGLGDIVDRFTQTGNGEKARSWIERGPNAPVAPTELESALGPETLDALQKQTGLSRSELLERLSSVLPEAVDKMTPDGRIPSEQEASRWL